MTRKKLRQMLTFKNILILLCLLGGLAFVGIHWWPQWSDFFGNASHVMALINTAGPLGPIIFVVLQAFQTIFAPIPGNVTGAVGGAVFGWWGLPLTIVGGALGMAVVVAISRKFGRPLLEKFFNKQKIKKLDWLLDHPAAEMVLFLIFLFPFMPDDIVGYLAGLTKIRFRNIMIISIVGKAPMQLVTNFFGANLLNGNLWIVLVVAAVIALLALVIFIKRQWFLSFIQSHDHWQFLKNSINTKNKVKSKHVSNHNQK
ncbi:MAG: TVP38/TMEM64 family protein [Candidatus Nomurabacteria bacterium]|jgi:uncharacterized membrane protein YdjX (TVP38/TMEM64 family)|nr:TVP38/TMEM64 family protein [Candidatus Nomurabacteria bacterium]